MLKTILGTKQEMSAAFDSRGRRIPITSIMVEPNVVFGVQNDRVQLGLGKKKKFKKPQNAQVKVAGYAPRYLREVKSEGASRGGEIKIGDKITASVFEPGDLVKISGITKGKGFAGGVKRWGFAGGPKTHGQSDRHRAPGSIGQTTTPGRVFKGKKMAGHMGAAKLTVTGLEVVNVNPEKNLLVVKGSIPGAKNGFLIIEKTGKAKKSVITEATGQKTEDVKTSRVESTEEQPEMKKASEVESNKSNQPEDQSTNAIESTEQVKTTKEEVKENAKS